jgi:cbb3-type cytochrome oxidase subunit 3
MQDGNLKSETMREGIIKFIFTVAFIGFLLLLFIWLYETVGQKIFTISGFAVIFAKMIMHEITTEKKK